jgi:hypothetical protein
MKAEDVPQDAGKLGAFRELAYGVAPNGTYTAVQSVGWSAKNIANDLVWEEIGRQVEAVRQDVKAGRKSPLAYHMVRAQMNEAMLADYTGFSRRAVRRHLEPEGFSALQPEELRRYAESLNLKVDDLCTIP